MQFPFALPTDNYLLIGGVILGLVIVVSYFLFFKKSAVPESSSSEEENPMKAPESFENIDAAGADDTEGYEQS